MTYDELLAKLALEEVETIRRKMRWVKTAWRFSVLAGNGDDAALEQQFLNLRDRLEVAEVEMHELTP